MERESESGPRKSASGRMVGERRRTNPAVLPVVVGTNQALDGGATGDGEADDAECEWAAVVINVYTDLAKGDEMYGDGKDAAGFRERAQTLKDEAMDRGCFFVDEPID